MKLFAARCIYVSHYTFLNHLNKRFYFYNLILTFKVIFKGEHKGEKGVDPTPLPSPMFALNHIGLRLFATGLVILCFKYDFSCCKYIFLCTTKQSCIVIS